MKNKVSNMEINAHERWAMGVKMKFINNTAKGCKGWFFCTVLAIALLAGCSAPVTQEESIVTGREADNGVTQEPTVLVLASFEDSPYLQRRVELYNQTHADYQIEIKRYERSENMEEDGVLLIQREIVSGKGPDIINYGDDYATGDIAGAYTEDLFPYMGEDYQELYFGNILKAFAYEESLYAVPLEFWLKSFAGRKDNLGERSSWTIREMMECYHDYHEQESDRRLYPGAYKLDVFGAILAGNMEYYIDWESGECSFNGEEFCAVLEFCNEFSDHLELPDGYSSKQAYLDDKALLSYENIFSVYDVYESEYTFGGQEVTFIGFPVEGKNGTIIESFGPVLAISAGSKNKDAAWEFISECLSPSAQRELTFGFPICRVVLEERIAEAMEIEYETDENGERKPVAKEQILFAGEDPVDIYNITQKQADQLIALIEQAEIRSQPEWNIYNVFLEEVAYYFSGAKSLKETADVIQARVSIYVNERIK